jgi:hypothetical protein
MTLEAIAGAIIFIASVATALGVIFRPGYKKAKEFGDWFDHFRRDWMGEEGSPGRDRVPGVMERLNKLDGELSQNGGKSTKDVVNKMFYKQEKLEEKADMMLEAFVEMGERLIKIEDSLNTQNK